jgi:Domain of unknown function (DUF4352)
MEIFQSVFNFTFGVFIFGFSIYCIFSPFALLVGLFKPSAVLNEKKPQTRFRVFKRYGVTTSILAFICFNMLVPAEESVYAATDTYTPVAQEVISYSEPAETDGWIKVRGDRAIQVVKIETLAQINSSSSFTDPVEAKGGQLAVVSMKLKNTGKESGNMAWTDFKLIDSQGRKYDDIDSLTENMNIDMWMKDRGLENLSSQMFPGAILKTAKVFRVASDASNFKLEVNGKSIDVG